MCSRTYITQLRFYLPNFLSQAVVAEVSHQQLPVVLFVFYGSTFSLAQKRECDVPITHANPICSSHIE